MAHEIVQYSIPDIEKMANAVAASGLFGIKTKEQALALMLIAQAEGRHPVEAARDYNLIQGRPSKTAEAMLRDFISSGGRVEWHGLDDAKADATFSHPHGGSVRIEWDMARAKKAGLGAKDMWAKYPRQMLRSRVISEGVRTVCPAATSGMYVPEEVRDFDEKPMKNITPEAANITTESVQEIMESAEARKAEMVIDEIAAQETLLDLQKLWKSVQKEFKDSKQFARIMEAKNKRKAELEAPPVEDLPDDLGGEAA